jgi:hypothetical protein
MRDAIARGDAPALSAAAHSFKGMYAVFAPNDAMIIAQRLEEMGRTAALDNSRAEYDRLLPAVHHFSRSMTARRARGPVGVA